MNFFLRPILLVSINFLFISQLFAQIDSTYFTAIRENAVKLHNKSLQAQLPIYNGKVYEPFPYYIKDDGHSYFLSGTMLKGSVVFDGVLYKDVDLKYNLVKDELVLQYYDKVSSIILDEARVDAFSLANNNFVKLKNSSYRGLSPDGYYHLLYNGTIKLLSKRKKNIIESVNDRRVERNIKSTTRYYILKGEVYHQINSKRALFKVLKQNDNQSQQYLASGKHDFKRDPENTILSLVKFYDKNIGGK
ncbi:MAG TPA: hypothetical protein VGB63_05875 [Pedobacter sp.]|jgi:hypothetical protein